MLSGLRSYVGYRRARWTATRELRGERRFRQGIEANFQDAAERARADQEYRGGPVTGRTRYRPRQR
jgi:hypothetical protein